MELKHNDVVKILGYIYMVNETMRSEDKCYEKYFPIGLITMIENINGHLYLRGLPFITNNNLSNSLYFKLSFANDKEKLLYYLYGPGIY